MKIKLDSNLAVPLFMQLAAALKEEIARGRWKPGDESQQGQVRQAKLGRTNSGRSYIVKKSTCD